MTLRRSNSDHAMRSRRAERRSTEDDASMTQSGHRRRLTLGHLNKVEWEDSTACGDHKTFLQLPILKVDYDGALSDAISKSTPKKPKKVKSVKLGSKSSRGERSIKLSNKNERSTKPSSKSERGERSIKPSNKSNKSERGERSIKPSKSKSVGAKLASTKSVSAKSERGERSIKLSKSGKSERSIKSTKGIKSKSKKAAGEKASKSGKTTTKKTKKVKEESPTSTTTTIGSNDVSIRDIDDASPVANPPQRLRPKRKTKQPKRSQSLPSVSYSKSFGDDEDLLQQQIDKAKQFAASLKKTSEELCQESEENANNFDKLLQCDDDDSDHDDSGDNSNNDISENDNSSSGPVGSSDVATKKHNPFVNIYKDGKEDTLRRQIQRTKNRATNILLESSQIDQMEDDDQGLRVDQLLQETDEILEEATLEIKKSEHNRNSWHIRKAISLCDDDDDLDDDDDDDTDDDGDEFANDFDPQEGEFELKQEVATDAGEEPRARPRGRAARRSRASSELQAPNDKSEVRSRSRSRLRFLMKINKNNANGKRPVIRGEL